MTSLLGLWIILENAYIVVLPAESHNPWAACIFLSRLGLPATNYIYTLYLANQKQHITDMKTILQTLTRCAT